MAVSQAINIVATRFEKNSSLLMVTSEWLREDLWLEKEGLKLLSKVINRKTFLLTGYYGEQ